MSERSAVTDRILDYCARTPGLFVRKIHCDGTQGGGLPDLWGCYRGMFIVCESKTPVGRLSALQKKFLWLITRAGGCAFVATSLEDFISEVNTGYEKFSKGLQTTDIWDNGP